MMKCIDSIFGGKRIMRTALKKESNNILHEKPQYFKDNLLLEKIKAVEIKIFKDMQTRFRRGEL